jgi:hypothetical protein
MAPPRNEETAFQIDYPVCEDRPLVVIKAVKMLAAQEP